MSKVIRVLCDTPTSEGVIKAGEFVELPEQEAINLVKSGYGDDKAKREGDLSAEEPKKSSKKAAK